MILTISLKRARMPIPQEAHYTRWLISFLEVTYATTNACGAAWLMRDINQLTCRLV